MIYFYDQRTRYILLKFVEMLYFFLHWIFCMTSGKLLIKVRNLGNFPLSSHYPEIMKQMKLNAITRSIQYFLIFIQNNFDIDQSESLFQINKHHLYLTITQGASLHDNCTLCIF